MSDAYLCQNSPRSDIALSQTDLHRVLKRQKNLVPRRAPKWVSVLRSYHYGGELLCYLFEHARRVFLLFGPIRCGRNGVENEQGLDKPKPHPLRLNIRLIEFGAQSLCALFHRAPGYEVFGRTRRGLRWLQTSCPV